MLKPIPENVSPNDPIWKAQFLLMANAMVIEGAKARIIERYTGLKHKQVARIYQELRQAAPPSGPVAQCTPSFFTSSRKNGYAWNVHSSIFTDCFVALEKLVPQKTNRGWLLLQAFKAYKVKTKMLTEHYSMKQLTFNHAYALLAFINTDGSVEHCGLSQVLCANCGLYYLVESHRVNLLLACPFCAINANLERLVSLASSKRRVQPKLSEELGLIG